MSDLHDGTLVTTLSTTDRIAAGIPGQSGCKNITMPNLAAQLAGGVSFVKHKNKAASFTITIAADTFIEKIIAVPLTGTIAIVIYDQGNEFFSGNLTSTESVDLNNHYPSSTVMDITITGTGTATFIVKSILNLTA